MAEMHKPKVLVIDRKRWNRGGKGPGLSALLNETGSMCCIGFYASACGLGDSEMLSRAGPEGLFSYSGKKLPGMLDGDICNRTASDLIGDNDNRRISESTREGRILAGFAKIGVRVRFVN